MKLDGVAPLGETSAMRHLGAGGRFLVGVEALTLLAAGCTGDLQRSAEPTAVLSASPTTPSRPSFSAAIPTVAPTAVPPVLAPAAGINVYSNRSVTVNWSDGGTGAGIASRTLQRQRGAIVTTGSCANVGFVEDGSPYTGASPKLENGLASGYCHRWTETLVDSAGNSSATTSGTVLMDTTVPAVAFGRPIAGGPTLYAHTFYGVIFEVIETESGFSGSNGWSLQRQIAVATGETCGTFANDTARSNIVTPSSLVTGVKRGRDLVEMQEVRVSRCYRWILTARDQAGNEAGVITSGSVVVDTSDVTPPTATVAGPVTSYTNSTTWTISWTESDVGSGVAERSVRRHRGAVVTPGVCVDVKFVEDSLADVVTTPATVSGLVNGNCYYWRLALTDRAGNTALFRTGVVIIDTTPPSADFSTPDEGTTTRTDRVSLTIDWSESDSSSGIATRSLERQVVSPTGSTCPSSGWTTNQTTAPVDSTVLTALQPATCYRWRVTVTDAAGNSATSVSGSLLTADVLISR